MKKKIMASLLVGSAVVGASLAPLSAQAVTTGNTPVQVEFGGGVLPDHEDNTGGSVDPDPTKPNTDFDLLAIPRSFDFPLVKIGEDLTSIKSISPQFRPPSVMVGDVRGTKEDWHVTGEIAEMKNGTDKLDGQFNFGMTPYYAVFNASTGLYGGMASQNGMNITDDPTAPSFIGTNMTIGGGATTLMNATVGQGQGTWSGRIDNMTLNVTTPYQQIKAGAYTGNITWNLVAGPSI
ncbi:WxL domain-containing protein [Enterococcus faecalis]